MVETDVRGPPGGRRVDGGDDLTPQRRRRVADPDRPLAEDRARGSDTIPAGFVKLTNHASGARSRHRLRDRDDDGNGAKREGDAAGTDRLLAEDADVERDALVDDPPRQAARPDRDEHRARTFDRVLEPRRRSDARPVPALAPATLEHLGGPREPSLVAVVQHELVDGFAGGPRDRLLDDRRAEPAPADERDLHRDRVRSEARTTASSQSCSKRSASTEVTVRSGRPSCRGVIRSRPSGSVSSAHATSATPAPSHPRATAQASRT